MLDLARRIQKIYPNADFVDRILLQDDGGGPYIKRWDSSLGAQPTTAQLEAVDVTLTPDEKTNALTIPKKVLAALVFSANTTGQPQWVIDAIAQAKTAITAARS